MDKEKTGFWRGFTWKRFVRNIILIFLFSMAFYTIYNYFDKTETLATTFTLKFIVKRAIFSIIWGFLWALWFELGMDSDKGVPPVIV